MIFQTNKVRVTVDLDAVEQNFAYFKDRFKCPVAVIKGDAYGHGIERVGQHLAKNGATIFAAGTVEEAVTLRKALDAIDAKGEIIALLSFESFEELQTAIKYQISPFVTNKFQFSLLKEAATDISIPYVLKFNTGMHRLGLSLADVPLLIEDIAENENLAPKVIASHFAVADMPGSRAEVEEQYSIFEKICLQFTEAGMSFQTSLTGSAGTLAYADLTGDLPRPGLSLFGGNPFLGSGWEDRGKDAVPTMDISTTVIHRASLAKGQSLGYGFAYTADKATEIAVIAIGYTDGYSRSLSAKGEVNIKGKRAPVLGRVCMQMTIIDVTKIPETEIGDIAYVLGGHDSLHKPAQISVNELATWWGTIPNEVLCILGGNSREYIN